MDLRDFFVLNKTGQKANFRTNKYELQDFPARPKKKLDKENETVNFRLFVLPLASFGSLHPYCLLLNNLLWFIFKEAKSTYCFRYSACIRQAMDHCCVEFRVCPVMGAFSLDDTKSETESTCLENGVRDVDYVVIAGEWADPCQKLF